MEELVLEVQQREEKGKQEAKALRKGGFIPAVLYGEGKKAQMLKIERRPFMRLLHEHRPESAIFSLRILSDAKKSKDVPAIIKELQQEPVKDEIIHIDFNEISLTKVIKVKVPIEAKGEPIGVKQEGGSLEHILWDLEIECLPTQIPEKVVVDVAALKIGDAIHVKDISLPMEIKVLHDADAVVLSVAAPVKEEAPAEEGVEPAATEPEVIKEKKEKLEEGPAAEGKEKKEEKPKAQEKAKEKEG